MALALAVIAVIFIFPSLSPFGSVAPASEAATTTAMAATTTTTNDQSASTTMPTDQNVTSLEVKDETVGTGAAAKAGDTVTVNYVGALTNGTVFDASANHGTSGFTFTLGAGQVIQGWDQGIVGMKVGGKRELVIPASLAYGAQGIPGVIPPNATLVFQVELLKVQSQRQ